MSVSEAYIGEPSLKDRHPDALDELIVEKDCEVFSLTEQLEDEERTTEELRKQHELAVEHTLKHHSHAVLEKAENWVWGKKGNVVNLDQSEATLEVWRNIHYGHDDDHHLDVFEEPGTFHPCATGMKVTDKEGASVGKMGFVEFGARLEVIEKREVEGATWLRLGGVGHPRGWVLAEVGDSLVCCTRMKDCTGHGRVQPASYAGQAYPEGGMFCAGYHGGSPVCVVSAPTSSLWREVNLAMLFSDVATASIFGELRGSQDFADWEGHYGSNCEVYGKLSTQGKELLVIVRSTERWREYPKMGPDLEGTKADLGRMQQAECSWLRAMHERLQLDWGRVKFLTAIQFLKQYAGWTQEDAQASARERSQLALNGGHGHRPFTALTLAEMHQTVEATRSFYEEAYKDQASHKIGPGRQALATMEATLSKMDLLLGGSDPKLTMPEAALQQLNSHNSKERVKACKAIQELRCPVAVQDLIARLVESNKDVSKAALGALVAVGLPAVRPLVERQARSKAHEGDVFRRTLVAMGSTAVPELLAELGSEDRRDRAAAIGVLGEAKTADAVPALRRCLSDPDKEVRRVTCLALGEIGPEAIEAAADLRALANAGDSAIFYARAALAKIEQ